MASEGGVSSLFFFFQAEDGIRDLYVTGVQTCALPISRGIHARASEILRQLRIEQDMTAAALPIRPQMEVRGPLDQPPEATIPTGGADFAEVSPCEGRSEERRVGKEGRWGGSREA